MPPTLRDALSLMVVISIGTAAQAHYNMLLPQTPSAKRGEAVTLVYQWGHPFEHQLFDAPTPQSLFVLSPDGKKTELGKTLEKVTGPKQPAAFRYRFTPDQLGDFVFVLITPPIWMEEEEEFFQDTVK